MTSAISAERSVRSRPGTSHPLATVTWPSPAVTRETPSQASSAANPSSRPNAPNTIGKKIGACSGDHEDDRAEPEPTNAVSPPAKPTFRAGGK